MIELPMLALRRFWCIKSSASERLVLFKAEQIYDFIPVKAGVK
jgi:hypothetical protein